MLTEEQKTKNFNLFIKKLKEINVNTELFENELKDKLMNASFSLTNETYTAYDGSFLNIILRIFTPYAIQLNNILHESLKVSTESLVKVCLLHQISKINMFIPNDNEWEKEKRGLCYKYAPYEYAFKMGMRSLILCQDCNIQLTPREIEAMTILDRDVTDEQARFRCNPMSVIIRQANEITNLQLKNINTHERS